MEKIQLQMKKFGFEAYYKLPFIDTLSKKSKQHPSVIVLFFLVIGVILLFTPIGSFFATFLAFTIPAFKTFQAIETETKVDDKRLLTFWVVFGFFYSFDQTLSFILAFIPFYYIFRSVFIAYLFLPQFGAADKIFTSVIEPFFLKYHKKIDEVIDPIEQKTRRLSQINKLKAE